MSLTKFLSNPTLLEVIDPVNKMPVTGLTVLGREIFVVKKSSHVFVYDCDSFNFIREFQITGSMELRGIVACSYYNCIYASDPGQRTIYRYKMAAVDYSSKSFAKVPACALSVTKTTHNVLATLYRTRKIQEYDTRGKLLKQIDLDLSIDHPYHSIQLSTGNFVVSHGGREHHRVCIVDPSGRLVQSYGDKEGSGEGQLCRPQQIAVDDFDNVVVADFLNNRVQMLSSSLKYLSDVIIPGKSLEHPYCIHVDEVNHRLYIGECDLRRVFVLGICDTTPLG